MAAPGFDVSRRCIGARQPPERSWHIENYVADCDQVAGTDVGRTAIEGWMCGKSAWVYDIVPPYSPSVWPGTVMRKASTPASGDPRAV